MDQIQQCDDCGEFLSHAPVFLRPISGGSVCNICAQGVNEVPELMRNRYYELVAQHLRFPCKYEPYGCVEVMVFSSEETEEHPHEMDCKFKAYLCPLDKIGECDWQGPVHSMYLHFLREHPLLLLENPYVFSHEIETSNVFICVVPAAGELFLIQAEVLVPEGRIHHSVRFFGKASLAQEFKFELFIQKNNTFISRVGNVLPIGNMEVTEATSITTKVSNLLDLMGSFENIQFSINIQNVDDLLDNETESFCHYCNKWKFLERGVCSTCRSELKFCSKRPEGCCQSGLSHKIEKHETFYCNFTNWCEFCDDSIYPAYKSKSHHYLVKHTPHLLETFVNITGTNGHFLALFFRSEYGIVFCNYYFSNKKLEMHIMTPFSNVELRYFRCKVSVAIPGTGHVSEFLLEQKMNSFYDWFLYLQKCNLPAWNTSLNIRIKIERE